MTGTRVQVKTIIPVTGTLFTVKSYLPIQLVRPTNTCHLRCNHDKMTIAPVTAKHHPRLSPLVLGVCAGLLVAIALAVLTPESETEPGDSKILNGIVGAMFIVPLCTASAYAYPAAFRNMRRLPVFRTYWRAAFLFFTLVIVVEVCAARNLTRRFVNEGRNADGTVIEPHPEDHDRLLVTYKISGIDYRILSAGPRVARSYKPGDAVTVYYFASAPADGFCVKPKWSLGEKVVSWIIMVGIFPAWAIALLGAFTPKLFQNVADAPPQRS